MAADRVDTLAQLAAVIGVELTLKLVERYGGSRMYIPIEPAGGELVDLIGEDATRRLWSRWRGTHFDMPIQRAKRERIIALSNSDERPPVREIARIVGCTERNVYKVRRDHRRGGGESLWVPEPDPDQISLFSAPANTEDK